MPNNIINELPPSLEKSKEEINILPSKNEEYEKKIAYLKRRATFNIFTTAALLLVVVVIIFYSQYIKKANEEDIAFFNSRITDLQNKSANIEAMISDAKKYKQIWLKADDKKKNFSSVKISDVNETFKNLVEKYSISESSINISVPEILKDGVYNRQVLDVYLINFVISFNAITDRVAVDFINSFINTLPGYVVISDVSIKKSQKAGYNESDLINISNGKINGLTSTKINLSWYFLKRKVTNQQQ
jgi:hypothetical protein